MARDAAHKRMHGSTWMRAKQLPIDDRRRNVIYYMGPSPAREGRPIGSAGPTTASRMDKYAPRLLDLGEKCNDRKRKKNKRSHRCSCAKSRGLLCGSGWCRCTAFQMYHKIRGCLPTMILEQRQSVNWKWRIFRLSW